MVNFQKYQTVGRIVLLLLLGLSFAGPWFFDLIMVPAEYECNLPFIRLEGDFCGSPLSYLDFTFSIFVSDLSTIRSGFFNTLTLADLYREYSFRFLFFLAALPFFSTLLGLWKPRHRSLQIFNWICWGLAVLIALGSLIFSEMLHPALWGFWLYRVSVLLALAWEVLMSREHHSVAKAAI
jgi:hypothetical protein